MGAGGEKRPGLSKDSVPMAASFQNSLEMKNNENHCGEQSDPGRRVPTSGLAKSPCPWLPEGTPVGRSPGDSPSPLPAHSPFPPKLVNGSDLQQGPLPGLQGEGATLDRAPCGYRRHMMEAGKALDEPGRGSSGTVRPPAQFQRASWRKRHSD